MFETIPRSRPSTPLLNSIDTPRDLRKLPADRLPELANELRHFLLYTVGQTGGHFGAGLGVVELTIALHYVFNTPEDRLVWDVGHQTYPHKILTGRREAMSTLRQPDGLAPFPCRDESPFDTFGTGHSSTSISAALGMALAGNDNNQTVVIIGDGAMTAGMAFEALNHLAATQADILIVLNDNAMSISENVGGLANYFARNITAYQQGDSKRADVSPGSIFVDLGLAYSGPIDGHDLPALTETLNTLRQQSGPRILHIATQKGKGYAPAERSPISSHSMTKLEIDTSPRDPSYSSVFGTWICEQAAGDDRLIAITPAMREGSGLSAFAEQFPTRFHDVAIAEQHAVTLAGGMAVAGAKPVVAIYSTFLQRAYDQLIHDIAIQNLDVLFAVDRAGLLEDGPTHSGTFDLAFCRTIPNLTVMAPADAEELTRMLTFGYEHPGPCLVRYPRGEAAPGGSAPDVQLGRARQMKEGETVAMLSFGSTLSLCEEVANQGNYSLVDMRFVKPIDERCVLQLANGHSLLVTIEEHSIAGGAGSAVSEVLARNGYTTNIINLGIEDRFVDQDDPVSMRTSTGLSVESIQRSISERLAKL